MQKPTLRTLELLAPAGNMLCARAAVENGADAVYFGLECGFNARARADNISLETLPELMQNLHSRGVKGFVTLNTLIFPDEMERFAAVVQSVGLAGADAVLVQDIGMTRLIRAICPELAIHASTQMSLTSAETIAEIVDLGIERVVLARELSLDEIRRIASETQVELEVFAHGALCVAYSGQCLTSESLGGRSANRGQCAQACRLPYDLYCDDQYVDLEDQKYLLSPQDLAAYELIPELLEAGVTCIKIEGRLKTPEYVANITRRYREAIEQAYTNGVVRFLPAVIEEMELSFSRGFSPGWLRGCDHKMLVPGLTSAKHGVLLGMVVSVGSGRVRVDLQTKVRPGDGIAFSSHRPDEQTQGGRVYEIWQSRRKLDSADPGQTVELALAHGAVDMTAIAVGTQVWKTDDPQLTKRLQKSFASGRRAHHRLPIQLDVYAEADRPLRVTARVCQHAVAVESDEPLPLARTRPVTRELLEQQFARLGHTAYRLDSLTATITGQPIAPLSLLSSVRRQMIGAMDAALRRSVPRTINDAGNCLRALGWAPEVHQSEAKNANDEHGETGRSPRLGSKPVAAQHESPASTLHVLARTLEQLQWLVDLGIPSLIADFQDIREYAPAVALALAGGATLLLATPRIQKPGEMGVFHAMGRHEPDGILARNLAAMAYFRPRVATLVADFSLNCTNQLTAAWLKEKGADRIAASYDMNREQLLNMVAATPTDWLEVVVHQQMPMFHMEHCVFCAVLSPGTNKTNCGRPCDEHRVTLRDRVGQQHVLQADVGCRNTLYNAQPQSAAEAVPALHRAGLRHFRIELLEEGSKSAISQLVNLYRELLAGRLSGREVWTQLKAANRVGVTRGTLEEPRNPLAIL